MNSRIAFVIFVVILKVASGQLVGGWSNADVTSQEVKDAAKKAVELYGARGSQNTLLLEILNATQQIVSGIKYKLFVNVGTTNCQRNQTVSRTCYVEEIATCTFEIVVQAWTSTYDLVSSQCGNSSSSWKRIQTNLKVVTDPVYVALKKMMRKFEDSVKLIRIKYAYKNVANPTLFKIVVIVKTKCSPCTTEDQDAVNSKVLLFIRTTDTTSELLDCRTDSPILFTISRCSIMR